MEQFEGYIENFNGVFGFVSFEKGVAFFHKSFLKPEFLDKIAKNKKVIFTAQPSLKKPDSWEVASFKSILEETKPKKNFYSDFSKLEIGEVDWFNDLKGFGVLKNAKGSFLVHKNKLLNVGSLSKNDICLFKAVFSDNKVRYNAHNVQLVNRLDLANIYLQIINKIDDNEKYQQVTRIYDKLDTNQRADFIQQAYQIADEQRKYQLWDDGLVKQVNLEYLAQKMTQMNDFSDSWRRKNPYEEIFKRLQSEQQQEVKDTFMKLLKPLDSELKYKQVKAIYDLLPKNERADFIQQAYQIADEQRKYVLLANYSIPVSEIELIKKWYHKKLVNFNFEIIKNLSQSYQKVFIEFFYEQVQTVGSKEKYQQVTRIYNKLDTNQRADFIQQAYQIANEKYKLLLLFFIADSLITFPDQLEKWLTASSFLLIKPKKNKYYNIPLLVLVNKDINYVINETKVFDNRLLENLAYYHRYGLKDIIRGLREFTFTGFKLIKFEDELEKEIDEFRKIQIVTNIRELSNYSPLSYQDDFFKKYVTIFINSIKNQFDYFLKNENELIDRLIAINTIHKEVCGDFISSHSIYFSTYVKMKLWVYDVYDVFDYNNYGFYYFRLNKYEKKRYNQKARELMKEDVTNMMIAQRIPWEYKYTDEQGINHYSASWRSLWFLDTGIKVCIKKVEDENIFSPTYRWEYSEEKFNFLFGYLSKKRIEDLDIEEKDGNILKIKGLERLEEIIYKVNLEKNIAEKGLEKVAKEEGENKIPPSLIIKNQCVNYLNNLQDADKNPTRILEISKDYMSGNIHTDTSLLFSITKGENVFIVWESLEFNKSKATHVFKIKLDEYSESLEKISEFLEKNLKVRSKLNSDSFDEKEKLKYLCRIDHDNFDFKKWEVQLLNILNS